MLIKKSIFRSHGDLSWGFQASQEATASQCSVNRMRLSFVESESVLSWDLYIYAFFLFFFFLPPKEGHCPDSYATFDRNSTALLEQLCCWVWSNKTALDWSPCLNGTCAGARQPRPSHNGFFASHLPSFPLFMMCFLRQRLEPWGVPLPVFCRKSPLEREKVCMSRTHQRACFHLHSAKKQMSNSLLRHNV